MRKFYLELDEWTKCTGDECMDELATSGHGGGGLFGGTVDPEKEVRSEPL